VRLHLLRRLPAWTECAPPVLRAPRGRPAAYRRLPDRHPLLADPEGRRHHRTAVMFIEERTAWRRGADSPRLVSSQRRPAATDAREHGPAGLRHSSRAARPSPPLPLVGVG